MKWRDIFGVVLLVLGVGGCMTGVRGFTGDAWWGAPAIGAGVVVNALAYRTMRPTRVERKKHEEREEAAASALASVTTDEETKLAQSTHAEEEEAPASGETVKS